MAALLPLETSSVETRTNPEPRLITVGSLEIRLAIEPLVLLATGRKPAGVQAIPTISEAVEAIWRDHLLRDAFYIVGLRDKPFEIDVESFIEPLVATGAKKIAVYSSLTPTGQLKVPYQDTVRLVPTFAKDPTNGQADFTNFLRSIYSPTRGSNE